LIIAGFILTILITTNSKPCTKGQFDSVYWKQLNYSVWKK